MIKTLVSVLVLSILFVITLGNPVAEPGDAERQLSEALQRAVDTSNYGVKRNLAKLRDVSDGDWSGFRNIGLKELAAHAAQNNVRVASQEPAAEQQPHVHDADTLHCSMCGAHLFDRKAGDDSDPEAWIFTQPSTSSAVVTDLHSEWSQENSLIELRCANCGSHLGHVDPGVDADAPLLFSVDSEKLSVGAEDSETAGKL